MSVNNGCDLAWDRTKLHTALLQKGQRRNDFGFDRDNELHQSITSTPCGPFRERLKQSLIDIEAGTECFHQGEFKIHLRI